MKKGAKSLIAGAVAGFLNGLLGAGGGIILVPLLRDWAGLEQKTAMASSVFIIAPLSALSAVIYWHHGQIDITVAWPYMLGGLVGGILAGIWFSKISDQWLRRGLGAILLVGGVSMLLR
ncbi:MAG: sulfite exporter TauE/SafE family protein [Oscillospiraceae bacterium]|nr:sulfite exporter TauE/SafE family protein [Oscillospiraceae bacterium]